MNELRPVMLVILDGFGYRKSSEHNAISLAKMPFFSKVWHRFPHAVLRASGAAVGLPPGYIGNSEVGHMTIGAGAIIPQPMSIINDVIKHGLLSTHEKLQLLFAQVKKTGKRLHVMGILSDGGVHGHENHIYAYIHEAYKAGVRSIIIHPFLDGRDCLPQSAETYLLHLDTIIKECPGAIIGSIHGRFYAMDRDHNDDRTMESVHVLTQKQKIIYSCWQAMLKEAYAQGITDEFILPTPLHEDAYIKAGDVVLCANIRPDRIRQLINDLCQLKSKVKFADIVTAVPYQKTSCASSLFYPLYAQSTLKEILNDYHKRIYTIAETEKYAHVTYFFDSGREERFAYETRVLIPSLKRKRYDATPEMSAPTITKMIKNSLKMDPHDFYLVNYANADMVAHTGNFEATIKAIQCLDDQLAILYQEVVQKRNGTLCITADHGNAEEMADLRTGLPKTAHTTNPVPFLLISNNERDSKKKLPLCQLSDIAPFLLRMMNLPVSRSMCHCCRLD